MRTKILEIHGWLALFLGRDSECIPKNRGPGGRSDLVQRTQLVKGFPEAPVIVAGRLQDRLGGLEMFEPGSSCPHSGLGQRGQDISIPYHTVLAYHLSAVAEFYY